MVTPASRRDFVAATSLLGLAAAAAALGTPAHAPAREPSDATRPEFPRQPLSLVREVVGASHRDLAKVRQLVEARPALAKAAWDWGFGDWETPLGAASHTGRREIALFLIDHGARPDIFTFAMLGNLAAVQTMIEAAPGLQRLPGPHGISLLRHARAGGEPAAGVAAYLESLRDAGIEPPSTPLTAADLARYTGAYRIEAPGGPTFEVRESRGALRFHLGESTQINLRHLGDHEFSPSGAEHVRLVFEVADERAVAVVIHDGPPAIRAVRSA